MKIKVYFWQMMREKWVSGKQRHVLPLTSFVRSSFLHLPEITKQLSSKAPHIVSQAGFPACLCWMYLHDGCSERCGPRAQTNMPALPAAASQHLMEQELLTGRDSLTPCTLGRKHLHSVITDSSLVLFSCSNMRPGPDPGLLCVL